MIRHCNYLACLVFIFSLFIGFAVHAEPFRLALAGDGSTDNTRALRDALEIARDTGRLDLPPGVFLTQGLRVPSGVQIRGVRGRTVIKFVPESELPSDGMNAYLVLDKEVQDVSVEGVTFDGAGTSREVALAGCSTGSARIRFQNCEFRNAPNGVYGMQTSDLNVTGCRFDSIYGWACIYVTQASDRPYFARNRITRSTASGIKVNSMSGSKPNNLQHDEACLHSEGPTILDNIVDYRGVRLPDRASVLGIELWGTNNHATRPYAVVGGCIGGVIRGNQVFGPDSLGEKSGIFGISCGGGRNARIEGNYVDGGPGHTIEIALESAISEGGIFADNVVKRCQIGWSVSQNNHSPQFLHNRIESAVQFGCQIYESCLAPKIVGNTWIDCGPRTIYLNNAGPNALIAENTFLVSDYKGPSDEGGPKDLTTCIYVLGEIKGVVVRGNTVAPVSGGSNGAGQGFLKLNTTSGVTIESNRVDAAAPRGGAVVDWIIAISGESKDQRTGGHIIRNNVLENAKGDAIVLSPQNTPSTLQTNEVKNARSPLRSIDR